MTCLGTAGSTPIYSQSCEDVEPGHDPVHRPSHYTRGKIEVIDFIEDQGLGYHLGQVIKYVCRAGHKDPSTYVQDLEKARWYLSRAIDRA